MADDPTDRNSEIWQLAQAGLPHATIADRYGISRQRVGQLVADMTPAVFGFTDRDRAQIRARETAVLEMLAKAAEGIINDPPLQHSAIGKPIEDPRHPGQYLINEVARLGAIRERRLASESLRRMTGADLGTSGTMPENDARRQAEAFIAAAREQRDRELAELNAARTALAALPQPSDNVIEAEIID